MNLGRIMILAGVILVCAGFVVIALQRANVPLGRLPGDVVWRGRNTTVYFPWVTCVVLSVIGSLILWFLSRSR